MGTFASIKTRVQNLVIDAPTTVQNTIGTLVNEAMRTLQGDHNFWVMEALAEYTTVADTRSLGATPSNFKEFRGDPYYLEDDGQVRIMFVRATPQDTYRAFNEEDIGAPRYILRSAPSNEAGASTFSVYPLSDSNSDYDDGEYRVKVPYWKYLTELSADGDTNWLTVNAEEYLVFKAASMAFGLDWDEERMSIWAQLAENDRKRVIKNDKLLRLSNTSTLVPRSGGYFDPGYRGSYR